jgi:transposase InsO family protein
LAQLLDHAEGATPNDIYFLIATEQIYVDLTATLLVEPERCFVFRDQQTALAYKAIVLSQASADTVNSPVIRLVPGTSISWDSKILTIVLVGETQILLQTENQEPVELEQTTFENLVRLGKITNLKTQVKDGLSAEARELLLKASEKDLQEANRRYQLIIPYLNGQPIEDDKIAKRTIRDWKAKYRQAEQKYGYGYIGLLSFDSVKGNSNRKLPEHVIKLIEKFIAEDYETYKQKRKFEVYGAFACACSEAGIPDDQIPSYKTFIREIKCRSGYEQTLKREGRRAAYSQESFYWDLELTTPRHGDFPFHICHIDHTQIDVELRCSTTGHVLGRAWATILTDAYTRRILAVYISYDPPSYRSCMMVLRICVKRHGRLPQTIVTDNGKEFHSTYFETLLALFECTLKHRPSAKSRFSSVCERLFGTANTQFFHTLAGNTQITKKVRLVTKSVNPKNLALWTLGLLYLYLCEWAYEIYDTMAHPALGQSPREAFAAGIAQYGSRSHRMIPYDETFRILTLPTTRQGKAKVQPGQGVKIDHKYYWSNAFRDPGIEKTRVEVRYEPSNAGIAYAYVRGQWVECISEYYALFRGRSEKEIQLATAELNKRKQNHGKDYKLRAKQLGEFLSSSEAEEVLLEQRLRDAQVREVFKVIEGGLPNRTPYGQSQEIDKVDHQSDRDSSTQSESSEPINPNKRKLFKSY